MRRGVLPVLLLAGLLGIWELYVDLGGADPLLLPAPHSIASALYDDRSTLWSNLLVTAQEIVFGVAVGTAIGFTLAVAIHFSETVRRAVYPLVIASQAVPIAAITPLFLYWLGFSLGSKLAVIALVSFFPVVVTTLDAFAAIDPAAVKLLRTFDARRLGIFRHLELRAALPGVFTGAKLAAVFSVIGAVFAEQGGSNHGLGYLFLVAQNQLLMPEAYAAIVLLSVFAITLFALLTAAERRTVPWAHQSIGEPH